jgi:hypothetical protein
VSIDYTALLGLSAGIQVAKADYDFTRDGGAGGYPAINTDIIPAGSLILGYAVLTTTALTYAGGGGLSFQANNQYLATPSATLDYIVAAWFSGVLSVQPATGVPIVASISGGTVTAGAVKIWVFYLPT